MQNPWIYSRLAVLVRGSPTPGWIEPTYILADTLQLQWLWGSYSFLAYLGSSTLLADYIDPIQDRRRWYWWEIVRWWAHTESTDVAYLWPWSWAEKRQKRLCQKPEPCRQRAEPCIGTSWPAKSVPDSDSRRAFQIPNWLISWRTHLPWTRTATPRMVSSVTKAA